MIFRFALIHLLTTVYLPLIVQPESVHTIKDALARISLPQSVQVTNSTTRVPVEASQQILIEALPPILVLHLKRFLYDVNAKGVVKLGKAVEFGPELEIGSGKCLVLQPFNYLEKWIMC